MAPLGPATSYSDLFEEYDSDFIEALNSAVLPGDVVPENGTGQRPDSLKRPRSPEPASFEHRALPGGGSVDDKVDPDTYGASRFGEHGEYMRRKRAKLQIQNAELDGNETAVQSRSTIFKGLAIYINGRTEPSIQELRKLIVEHGGIFHAYLDQKSLVTHIITCSLTPVKIRDFKHMKVVTPAWLVDSAQVGTLLPWQDYVFQPGERAEDAQGRKVAQKSLLDGFSASQKRATGTPNNVHQQTAAVQQGQKRPRASGRTTPEPPPVAGPSTPKSVRSTARDPMYTTDPLTRADAARVPGYAAQSSNAHAARALQSAEWRGAHTAAAGADFIDGYYRNSRLHHLSTWKAELRGLVREAQERAEAAFALEDRALGEGEGGGAGVPEQWDASPEDADSRAEIGKSGEGVSMRGAAFVLRSPGKGKGKARDDGMGDTSRVIMHCDFDSFFVSAGLIDRPELRGKPVVVCHSQGNQASASSTSEIASSSYEARKFGVRNGMSLQQARKLCPEVVTIPYEFEKYKNISLQFYTILMAHADDLQAVSVDEALIDVTSSVARMRAKAIQTDAELFSADTPDPTKEFAERIRTKVRKVTGCEVSIGIAHNIMLARLATRRAKPAGSYHLRPAEVPEFVAALHVDDLHGFGRAARDKAEEKLGTSVLGELALKSKAALCDVLGRGTGETLYNAIRGVDERRLESDKPRKSVSCEINYGIRFENNDEAEAFMFQLAEEVARRLDAVSMRGRSLTLKVMKRDVDAPFEPPKFLGHGICDVFSKQIAVVAPGGRATSDPKIIGEHAWRLLKSFAFDPKELRGIGIQMQKLDGGAEPLAKNLGQSTLGFKRAQAMEGPVDVNKVVESSSSANKLPEKPVITVEPPSQEDEITALEEQPQVQHDMLGSDLPSFSQVDMSVFDALPEDIRKELEDEYRRRSEPPVPPLGDAGVPSRMQTPVPEEKPRARRMNPRLARIVQQLAPRGRRSLSPKKGVFGVLPSKKGVAKRIRPSSITTSEEELQRLNIDPLVFVMLPPELQREQLAGARFAKKFGTAELDGPRKVIKPIVAKLRLSPYRRARPKAKFVVPATLKQQGAARGEKLFFTETDDVQRVIEAWVARFAESPPNEPDVGFFAKFLLRCVDSGRSTDTGVEKAVAVMKWWLVLLRRRWGVWERTEAVDSGAEEGRVTSEVVGKAWWKAFRDVKSKMDVVARKKFGGSLSIR